MGFHRHFQLDENLPIMRIVSPPCNCELGWAVVKTFCNGSFWKEVYWCIQKYKDNLHKY